jgi:hypothetical protein
VAQWPLTYEPLNNWIFRVYCEEIFTTETQRGYAATKTPNASRKGRKGRKEKDSELGVLGVLARE